MNPAQPDLLGRTAVPSGTTRCARLAALFNERPGVWLDGRELATVGGAYAWRTRVSDLRRPPHSLRIENRQRHERGIVISEYRFVPEQPGETS
jgi:hypothetical protein